MKVLIPLLACVVASLAQPGSVAVNETEHGHGHGHEHVHEHEPEHTSACAAWPCSTVERRVGLKGKQVFPSIKRSILECVEESKVSPQLVLQVTSGNWSVREEYRLKMWALCLLLKSKMISKEGVFHLDVALSTVPDQDKGVVEKAIDECLFTKLHKPEETAWHFLKCYHSNKPKHSFM